MKHILKTCAAFFVATSLVFSLASCKSEDDDSSPVAVTSVGLSETTATITVGGTKTLTATVKPDNATDKTVTWTSSDETVATVANGVVTAKKAGTATITAKAGNITATCAVTVSEVTYTVTVTSGTANPTTAAAGTTVTITANDPAEGKVFDKWTSETTGVTFTDESASSTTFTMPASAVTITATYKDAPAQTYAVTVTSGTANPTTAAAGTTVTITANDPAEGKVFDKWTTTSSVTFADESTSPTTFTMPASAVTVTATYKDAPWDGDLSKLTAQSTEAYATATDGMTLTGTLANNVKISIADGATVTLKNASINAEGTWTSGDYAGLTCLGDATITLEEESTNTVKGFNIAYPGIYVPGGKTLTINGSGALVASPNTTNAGMSSTGAGIGGGVGLSCGNITIEGGTITATTANRAAAIGSGGNYTGTQTCGNITITGGTVTATCLAMYGAGIGAGIYGECGNISITGGTVTASGSQSSGGAGIGCGGTQSTVGTITIADTVTKVTAVKGYNAQSIGKGFSSDTCVCGTITIGGIVYNDGIAESPYTYPKIVDLSTLTADTTVADGYTITGTLAVNVKVSIADGATVTLNGVTIEGESDYNLRYAGITCQGNATVLLADSTSNTLKGFSPNYPGIYVPVDKTLTIKGETAGTGVLNASSNGRGAGIGGGYGTTLHCGNIVIEGGVIIATGGDEAAGIGASWGATNGTITISGGTVTATGGNGASGIGSGHYGSSGNITIADTVTKVTATKGEKVTYIPETYRSIGKGEQGSCGTVTIGGTEYADGITESPYTYDPKAPTGGINALFSVSDTKQVYFSKGNLQATYDGSSWTWSFAEHQYDAVGDAVANTSINGNGTVSANGSVDLFGWVGASSAFTGMAAFGISNSRTNDDYGTTANEALKNDWGSNAISNGGNDAAYGWRTLTYDEWNYVVKNRTDADSKRAAATVNDVKGWILLPDAWTLPAGASFTAGAGSEYTTNTYTAEQWAVMESAGAVFLPITGMREGSSMIGGSRPNEGYYWSTTSSGALSALNANFTKSGFKNSSYWTRYFGAAIRLAKDAE